MDVDMLPTHGMAIWYLHQTNVRMTNQCLMASSVIAESLQSFSLTAACVAVELTVTPDGSTNSIRYGGTHPKVVGTQVVGHIGVVADGVFVDPTSMQFPEIRGTQQFPLVARTNVATDAVLSEGVSAEVRFDGGQAHYCLFPGTIAETLRRDWVAASGVAAETAIHNLRVSFAAALAAVVPNKVETLRNTAAYADLVALVDEVRGKDVSMVGNRFTY